MKKKIHLEERNINLKAAEAFKMPALALKFDPKACSLEEISKSEGGKRHMRK